VKSASTALAAHLEQEVTMLATCWRLTRTDGLLLCFTDHDRDLVIEGLTSRAASAYSRTAIASRAGLAFDNLDLVHLVDSLQSPPQLNPTAEVGHDTHADSSRPRNPPGRGRPLRDSAHRIPSRRQCNSRSSSPPPAPVRPLISNDRDKTCDQPPPQASTYTLLSLKHTSSGSYHTLRHPL
jgi:hypothetical protein